MVRFAAALLLALAASPGAADCRLALLLGLDISSSVDEAEDALQRGGLAAALKAEEVQAAFFASPTPVALAVFEWSGRYNQEVLLDWTRITSPAALTAAAGQIAASRRSYNEFPTAMGEAMFFAADMLEKAPPCWERKLDISGDGESNEGPGPRAVYDALPLFQGVTVNGLVIVNAADFQTPHRLTQFYLENVLHGPGAFMVEANGFADFERAMRVKLERELQMTVIGAAEVRE